MTGPGLHKVKCDISEVTLLTEDILLIEIQPEKEFKLRDFNQLFEAAKQIGGGRKFYNLCIVGAHTLPSHKAREASTSKEGCIYKKADAFVIHSAAQKFVGNVYLKFHKPCVPTKFFTNREKAEKWLREMIKAEKQQADEFLSYPAR
ncbi:MAG: hypothetical protein K0R65_574 [Crocinitomicaceae bacterium]|jgi:hypothetical protein|nr:hypothetical protein [Crocinitomicaceae bacterium]